MTETPAVYEPGTTIDLVPMPVMSLGQAVARLKEFQTFVSTMMVKDVDYGIIPGTPKPTLLKPGAEKLAEMYGLAPTVEVTHRVEDWEHGFFHYEVRVRLVSKRTGAVVAEGLGSCNSREARYVNRWVFASDIPDDVDKTKLQKREGKSKKTGRPYTQYLWSNTDPYTQVNTFLKIAKKRGVIDATLSATRSSGMFTQDVEDWVEGEAHEIHEPGPESKPAPDASPKPADAAHQERETLLAHYHELVEALPLAGLQAPGPLPSPITNKALREINERLSRNLDRKRWQGEPAPNGKAGEAEALAEAEAQVSVDEADLRADAEAEQMALASDRETHQ